jgi:hypothetical protein
LELSDEKKEEEGEEEDEEEGEEGERDLNDDVVEEPGDDENSRSPRFKKFAINLIANHVIEFERRKLIRTKAMLDNTRPDTIQ